MKTLEVSGKRKLKGIIRVSGSKNASLPILAASILSNKTIKILNLPKVKDIETMISVGATENIIIAACFAKGKTILKLSLIHI